MSGVRPGIGAAEATKRVRDTGAVVILRGAFSPQALLEAATVIVEEGMSVIEVTLNSTDALEAIALLQAELGDAALVGVAAGAGADDVRT
ncbi:MAG TPA: hypothetical protein VFD39_07435, partial [Trueperaceae bacterium]|nr:hypothetical protein [Trueperaceae bacterium]